MVDAWGMYVVGCVDILMFSAFAFVTDYLLITKVIRATGVETCSSKECVFQSCIAACKTAVFCCWLMLDGNSSQGSSGAVRHCGEVGRWECEDTEWTVWMPGGRPAHFQVSNVMMLHQPTCKLTSSIHTCSVCVTWNFAEEMTFRSAISHVYVCHVVVNTDFVQCTYEADMNSSVSW